MVCGGRIQVLSDLVLDLFVGGISAVDFDQGLTWHFRVRDYIGNHGLSSFVGNHLLESIGWLTCLHNHNCFRLLLTFDYSDCRVRFLSLRSRFFFFLFLFCYHKVNDLYLVVLPCRVIFFSDFFLQSRLELLIDFLYYLNDFFGNDSWLFLLHVLLIWVRILLLGNVLLLFSLANLINFLQEVFNLLFFHILRNEVVSLFDSIVDDLLRHHLDR